MGGRSLVVIGLDWIGFDGWKVIVGDDELTGDMKE